MVNLDKRVIMVKCFGQFGKNIFSQNGHIGKKKSIVVIMVKKC